MTKQIRLLILLVCVVCFFVIAPVLVLYSMGDRFDFEKVKITATGGIYVRTFPAADQIIIDSKAVQKPGIFSNSVFVQSLLPKDHAVLVKKTGYYDYLKTLPVKENQVTKIENVLLFKKNIHFQTIADQTQSPFLNQDKFVIKTGNLYYSNVPENSALTSTQKSTPIIKKLAAFTQQNNTIVWLGADGLLYRSDLASPSAVPAKLTAAPLKIIKTGTYKVITGANDIFVYNNGGLSRLNPTTKELDDSYSALKDLKVSPDNKNVIFYNDNSIYVSLLPLLSSSKNILLYKSSEKIANCLWLNNDYIIFTAGNEIIISEIDYRGNINTVTLDPDVKSPEIYFNRQDGKIYILTGNILLSSERILP